MTNESLKEYLRDVFQLESMLYSYRCVEKKYNEKIVDLSQITAGKLQLHKNSYLCSAEYKNKLAELKSKRNKCYIMVAIVFLVCFVLWLAFIYWSFWNKGERYQTVSVFLQCLPWAVPIPALIAFIVYCKTDKEYSSDYDKFKWHGDDESYHAWERRQVAEAIEAKKPMVNHLKKQLEDDVIAPAKRIQDILDYMYSMNVLQANYRNFMAVAQIYEYIDTGRCIELAERGGAYDVYNREVAQKYITDKADQVLYQKEVVRKRMNYVADAIAQAEKLAKDATPATDRMGDNVALTSYYVKCKESSDEIAKRNDY